MIDFRKSIVNLHNKFPNKSLDELLEIMDCIVEVPTISWDYPEIVSVPKNPLMPNNPLTTNPIYCSTDNKNCM